MTDITPKVRTAMIIMNGEKVLLGEIKSGAEKGTWMFPWHEIGFKDSYYKNIFTGLWEDVGFRCTNVFIPYSDRNRPIGVTNDIFSDEEEHYVTLFHRGVYTLGKSTIGSKNKGKYIRFDWFRFPDLGQYIDDSNTSFQNKEDKTHPIIPYPLSQSIKNLLQQGYNPFENLDIPETLKTKSC